LAAAACRFRVQSLFELTNSKPIITGGGAEAETLPASSPRPPRPAHTAEKGLGAHLVALGTHLDPAVAGEEGAQSGDVARDRIRLERLADVAMWPWRREPPRRQLAAKSSKVSAL